MQNHWSTSVLKLAAATTILFGVMLALIAFPPLSAPATWFTDLVIWPFDGQQPIAATEARLYGVVLGGVMMGWGVMQWMVLTQLHPSDPILARKLMMNSAIVWFVVDSTGSVIVGGALNVLPNAVLLAMIVLPIVMTAGRVRPQAANQPT